MHTVLHMAVFSALTVQFRVLLFFLALSALAVPFALSADLRNALARNLRALAVLVGGVRESPRAAGRPPRHLNPVVFACAGVFIVTALACWLFVAHMTGSAAEERLLNAASDMHAEIDDCVDQLLFYQGSTICKNFGAPKAMSDDELKEVMKRYDIDELNVVDSRGVVVAGDLAEIGFRMDSKPVSGEFNRLLRGETTYSQPFRGAIENPNLRRKYVGVAFPPPAKGYLQIGYDEHRLKNGLDYRFASIAKDWLIGESGFFVVAKEATGEIDSCGKLGPDGEEVFRRGDTLAGIGFDVSKAPKDPHEFFTATLYGEKCLCLSEVQNFHRCIAAMPVSEIAGGFRRTITAAIAGLVVLFVVIAFFMVRLSDLVDSLKGYIADAKKQAEKDMAMAKEIQANVLPSVFPPYPNLTDSFDIHARMIAAREVGGDFYDFFLLERDRLAMVMADVSGKGVPAALFMMRAKTMIQALLKSGMELAAAVGEANERLSESNEANMFVTAWIGVVDLATGAVEYVNAGHNPPVLKRASGSVEYLGGISGPPLAAVEGVRYRKKELSFAENEGVVLYTDGVTEATDRNLALYGEDRLLRAMKRLLGAFNSKGLIEGLVNDVAAFADGAEQADDITILAFKFKRKVARE
ncbi:MAG: serine/threonine-protein phosphatase [Kiritimatiellae bacterium]|nr:serine/threonine-protein phosphatase [Kiritimatiellia bacterium]